jgi:EAL domain-containing protein (putative c-di-GMP-specific phosphodiesterase class I)
MSSSAQRRLKLHGSLQGAADRGELTLVYQPLLDLADNSLHGVEALARWAHPELGAISPKEFVPLAEDTGLATRLGAWVLRDACREAVAWSHLRAEPLPVSVNVSGHQLMDSAICDTISEVLAAAGLDPALLTLEITESVLMSEPDAVRERLTAIRALGCRISIDDFGTGYSSLASLARFPIDELKIDQTFVAALPHDTATERVARAIIDLAEGLNLRTVAEGIETHQQLHMLTAMGCTTGQGYLFARPMAADAVMSWKYPTLNVATPVAEAV